ncbi:MAG: Stp1/IreP family PP2C-type Ser/Thr phosphatase [Pseudomonadota bacterium]
MSIVSLKGKIQFSAMTDTGRVREHNEDAIATNVEAGLLVLADGMGGYNAGEVASGIAVKTVHGLLSDAVLREKRGEIESQTGFMRQSIALRDGVRRANKIIHQTADSQPQCEGMGTTIVAALFHDNRMSVAHVGDSRLYRLRGGDLKQLTLDHSLLQELVDRGFYSEEEAQRSTNRNYVTRALGVEAQVEVEIQELSVEVGDLYLLCSDGLPDMVEQDDIHLTISQFSDNLEVAAKKLVALANEHGGRDNISVMLARIKEPFPAHRSFLQRLGKIFGF